VPELDTFVDLLAKESGVYGARLSGGGFGGAVMAMTTASFSAMQADDVATAWAQTHAGQSASVFHVQTGPGARVLEF